MLRNREAITERSLKKLRTLASVAKGHLHAVEELLIRELSGWEEAEWHLKDLSDVEKRHKAIDNAVRNIGCTVGCCDSVAHHQFQKKWGASIASFPHYWHTFVSSFMTDMLDSDSGRKIALNLEYEFGYATPPDAAKTEEAVHARELATSKALKKFKKEANFWCIDNLCKLFISYLAILSEETGFNKTHFDEQVHHIRDVVIKNLIANIVNVDDEILYTQFDKQAEILKLIFSQQDTKVRIAEEESEFYQNVKAIFDLWKPAREEKKKLHHGDYSLFLIKEWVRVNQLTYTHCTDSRLFEKYIEVIDELHAEWNSLVNKPVLPKWGNLPYMLGGASIGAIVGGGIVLGVLLVGALSVCAPVVIGAVLLVVGVATIGSLVGFAIKKFREADSPEVLAAEVEAIANVPQTTTTTSSLRHICTTGLCALIFGFAGCSLAANVINPVSPIEQQSSQDQDDQDDATEEAEVSPSASGKRFG